LDGGANAPDGGASAVDGGGGAAWRPFNAQSPWNTPIPANPALESDSAALIADLATSSPWGTHLDVNIEGYSIPLYFADATTPLVTVRAMWGGAGWSGNDGHDALGQMPLPSGALPDPEDDHHLLVVDRARGIEWGCWNVQPRSGTWTAGLCATANLTGTGVRVPSTQAAHWYDAVGARACGFPLIAGLIRTEEIAAGRIDHALVIAYPHIRAGWFTAPASTAQGRVGSNSISTRGIPCGGRIQLDPALSLDIPGLSRAGRIILRALQEYGAYVGDYSGAISLYAENSAQAQAAWRDVLDPYALLDKLDFTRLRVLRYGPLYDHGNGG
jgi:hypothetical protein